MEYEVIYDNGLSHADKQAGVDKLNQICRDCGHNPTYTLADIPDTTTITLLAANRIDLGYRLKHDRNLDPDRVMDVKVLRDDSKELVSDIRLMAIADAEPTCAHYDWTHDNVLNFARKVIEEYKKAQNEDNDRRME
jgi:hypothetical protein